MAVTKNRIWPPTSRSEKLLRHGFAAMSQRRRRRAGSDSAGDGEALTGGALRRCGETSNAIPRRQCSTSSIAVAAAGSSRRSSHKVLARWLAPSPSRDHLSPSFSIARTPSARIHGRTGCGVAVRSTRSIRAISRCCLPSRPSLPPALGRRLPSTPARHLALVNMAVPCSPFDDHADGACAAYPHVCVIQMCAPITEWHIENQTRAFARRAPFGATLSVRRPSPTLRCGAASGRERRCGALPGPAMPPRSPNDNATGA